MNQHIYIQNNEHKSEQKQSLNTDSLTFKISTITYNVQCEYENSNAQQIAEFANNYLNELNDKKLHQYQPAIIDYFKRNQIDEEAIRKTKAADFRNNILGHCYHDSLNKLYEAIQPSSPNQINDTSSLNQVSKVKEEKLDEKMNENEEYILIASEKTNNNIM
eukprot:132993_1